jgi:hypothetical protein
VLRACGRDGDGGSRGSGGGGAARGRRADRCVVLRRVISAPYSTDPGI